MVEQLQEMRELHEQLLLAARNKQKSMRSGDLGALDSWAAREKFLIDRITATDAARRQTAEDLARTLGMEEPVTLTRLADRLAEPGRSRLLALAGVVRGLAEQIYQANQVNDAVTRELLDCFAHMQRHYTAAHCDIGLYDTRGQRQLIAAVNLLDAVG